MRAQQTARPIASGLALQPVPEAGLREQSFGRVDGMRVDDIKAQHPEAWEGWLRFDEHYAMRAGFEFLRVGATAHATWVPRLFSSEQG